jgi:hypothetical protein
VAVWSSTTKTPLPNNEMQLTRSASVTAAAALAADLGVRRSLETASPRIGWAIRGFAHASRFRVRAAYWAVPSVARGREPQVCTPTVGQQHCGNHQLSARGVALLQLCRNARSCGRIDPSSGVLRISVPSTAVSELERRRRGVAPPRRRTMSCSGRATVTLPARR